MAHKYTYSIANDTLNGVVNPTTLNYEIQASEITVAVSFIDTNDDSLEPNMEVELGASDKAILDAVIAAHTGEPTEEIITPVIIDGERATTNGHAEPLADVGFNYKVPAGTYKLAWSCEAKTEMVGDTEAVVTVEVDGVEKAYSAVTATDWRLVAGCIHVTYDEPTTPVVELKCKVVGNRPDTAFVRRICMSFDPLWR